MKVLLSLFDGLLAFGQNGNWKMLIMWAIGGVLIYLAIKKEMAKRLFCAFSCFSLLPSTALFEGHGVRFARCKGVRPGV